MVEQRRKIWRLWSRHHPLHHLTAMKRLILNTDTDEFTSYEAIRPDGGEIEGLDPSLEVYTLIEETQPQYDPADGRYDATQVIDSVNKTVTYGWEWVPSPPPPVFEPQPDYIGFWDAIVISDIYAELLRLAMTNLSTNTALTAFIAAFQDAKAGRPNVPAIQACIFLVLQSAETVLNAEHVGEIQAIMTTFALSDVYTLVAPSP
jgi:hypothetical protein